MEERTLVCIFNFRNVLLSIYILFVIAGFAATL